MGATSFRSGAWRLECLFAVPIIALVAFLFYNWFAVMDRYFIFLYYHDMGPRFDTTPFGWVTVGRYWMSGLVASGAVMVLYLAINFVLGRVVGRYRAPDWWRLWLLSAVPLAIIIPAIVMTVNDPVLPLGNAAQVTLATVIGLALAVTLGRTVAERPLAYALLMIDGLALTCLLTSLIRIESVPGWLARGSTGYVYGVLAMVVVGVALLAFMTVFYRWWRRTDVPSARSCFVAGLSLMYLFLPLSHHLFFSVGDDGNLADPGHFVYISDAGNYFAQSVVLQIAVWIIVALTALGFTLLRLRLVRGPTALSQ